MRSSILLSVVLAASAAAPVFARSDAQDKTGTQDQSGARDDAGGTFSLGQIIVTAPESGGIGIGSATLSSDAIQAFGRTTLDEAVNLMPGVSSSNSGGSRNERLVFVRGFDRFQVPLSIDGIRVYLPADNRLDYGRFLTADIAQVQVAKGYASVLDGPGAMGGAINLVTRKPTQALEAEAQATIDLDRDADYAGYALSALLGTKHDKWYAQGSYTRRVTDHWDLPGGYTPVDGSAEDGGARDFSDSRDWRVNAKIGFTPNATDEYAISYTRQEGSKNAPLHVTDPVSTPLPSGAPNPRYWSWPYWNIENIYFLSTTALGDRATLKTRIYRNSFDNLLRSFNDATQTTQSIPRAFNSYYADRAWGGSAQLDVALTDADRFSVAAHYRRDRHSEWQSGFYNPGAVAYTEPRQDTVEDTYSIAAENRLALTPALSVTAGLSYDWRDTKKAEEFTIPPATFFRYPVSNVDAVNAQGRIDWTPGEDMSLHAGISSRARFPTIFERFSTQFGTAASNPGLRPERATSYEVGGARRFGPARVEGALFYSHITDAIVSVRPDDFPANTSQRRNLGSADYYGAEIAFSARLSPSLELGANYSYTHRSFDIGSDPEVTQNVPVFRLTDVPTHKGFAYLSWSPAGWLTILPSLDVASNRTTLDTYNTTAVSGTRYYRTGSYAVAGIRADFTIIEGVEFGVGARNLFDDDYQLTDGFPEPGRSFYASLRARY